MPTVDGEMLFVCCSVPLREPKHAQPATVKAKMPNKVGSPSIVQLQIHSYIYLLFWLSFVKKNFLV